MDPVRRRFVARLGGSLAVMSVAAVPINGVAADGRGPRRIAWIWSVPNHRDRIRSAFRARGIVEGRDITLTFADYPMDCEVAKALGDRLAREKPDIIVFGSSCLLAFLPPHIPAVFYNMAGDPAKMGVVESHRRPGGHITGTTLALDEMIPWFWQQFKAIVPGMKRAGVVVHETDMVDMEIRRKEGRKEEHETDLHHAAGARLGVEIVDVRVSRNATGQEIIAALQKAGVKAAYFDMHMANVDVPGLAGLLKSSQIASMTHSSAARRGILLSWSYDFTEGESYAVTIVERILRGERPAEIPVYRARSYSLAINRTTARALGLAIPPSLLIQAGEVFD